MTATTMTMLAVLLLATSAHAQSATKSDDKSLAYEALRERGYNCPSVSWILEMGEDHYGAIYRVKCDPVLDRGFYRYFDYKFTFRPNRTLSIEPWQ